MKRLGVLRPAGALLAVLVLSSFANHAAPRAPARALPNPVLYLLGYESFASGGKTMLRYRFGVQNASEYPADMFAPAPKLPPCGQNANSSRTWVDIYDQAGKRLNGFCALGKPESLNGIWFALEEGAVPPSWVYVEMHDRATNTKYKSNLAETTP